MTEHIDPEAILGSLLIGAAGFRPLAYHDAHMDCIRVQFRDRSVVEHRVHELLTVLMAAHPRSGEDAVVGLVIKGVGYLFDELGLPKDAVIMVTDIIDRFLKKFDGLAPEAKDQVARVRAGASIYGLRCHPNETVLAA